MAGIQKNELQVTKQLGYQFERLSVQTYSVVINSESEEVVPIYDVIYILVL